MRPARRPATELDAYTFYLRGRYAANKRTAEGFALAIEYFEQAVRKDPEFGCGPRRTRRVLGHARFSGIRRSPAL